MNKENIYGVFEFKGKEYPFALENQILTIPQIPFQHSKDFDEIEHIETIQGVTNSTSQPKNTILRLLFVTP